DEIASETILDTPPAADEDNTAEATSDPVAATEEDVPVVDDVPEEPVVEVEVKEHGDVIELSGEAVVDEPIVVETTTDEDDQTDPQASSDDEADADDQKTKDKD
ncbi:MAG: hypothetical protein WA960_22280, partial [Tunicatimonas sp.]